MSKIPVILALLVVSSLLFFPTICLAIAPPEIVVAKNRTADIIVVAEVLSLHQKDEHPYFLVQPLHVIKGNCKGMQKILYDNTHHSTNKEIVSHQQGVIPVSVSVGDIVVGYLNPSNHYPEFLKPFLQGLSIARIYSPATK